MNLSPRASVNSAKFSQLPTSFPFTNRGDRQETRGTAFVVYEDIYDAKNAVDHLSGFNVCGRYLIVLYYQPSKMMKNLDNAAKKKELEEMRAKLGLNKQES
jgi:pre-mRNA branch site protein p14